MFYRRQIYYFGIILIILHTKIKGKFNLSIQRINSLAVMPQALKRVTRYSAVMTGIIFKIRKLCVLRYRELGMNKPFIRCSITKLQFNIDQQKNSTRFYLEQFNSNKRKQKMNDSMENE